MKKKLPELNLLGVIGLLLVPILLLGWLFFNESKKSITFAEQELRGIQFLEKFMPIFNKIVAESPITAEDRTSLVNLKAELGQNLYVSFELDRVLTAISEDSISRTKAIENSRQLIAKVADNSNLILDPDLDTYYLVDATVSRVPELLTLASDITANLNLQTHSNEAAQNFDRNLLKVGQFNAALKGLHQAMNSAILGNKDGNLKFKIASENVMFQTKASGFIQALDINAKDTLAPKIVEARAPAVFALFLKNTTAFWHKSNVQLKIMVQSRMNEFARWLYLAIGISALLTMAALSMSIAILKKLVHRLDDKIIFLAHHDPMTRLKNRAAFNAEAHEILDTACERGEKVALHLIDLDKFKSINDNFGHQTGDHVLKTLANRLVENCRPNDLIGRLGGDEFVILQRFVTNPARAERLSNRLVTAMRQPMTSNNQPINISISVGVAVSPSHGKGVETLMAHADMALYAAKAAGRDQFLIFNAALERDIKSRRALEEEIKHAAREELFTLNYQAQYNSAGTEIRGFEALLRLRGRDGVVHSPASFIPVAEQLGLITQIGAWVIAQACQAATSWPENITIAVNLSPLQFAAGGIAQTIAEVLKRTGLKPHRLEVEITEGLLMQNTEEVLAELKSIRALGVSIAMDDFGAGYSSLSYLWRFPFNKIKIDRSFVKALEKDDLNAQNVLRTIVVLGHSLKMVVTAEGVETVAQAEFIRELKCDQIQGFLYSRPMPEHDLAGLILKSFVKSSEQKLQPEPKLRLVQSGITNA